MRILFTDTDYNAHRSVIGGGVGGGGMQNNGSSHVYFVVQIPPSIDWTCAGAECGAATAEITLSL